jgi:hypothetical protein
METEVETQSEHKERGERSPIFYFTRTWSMILFLIFAAIEFSLALYRITHRDKALHWAVSLFLGTIFLIVSIRSAMRLRARKPDDSGEGKAQAK